MHTTIEPAILYFGTPVVVLSTRNENGSTNLAPMSSAFWLGWRCLLGLASASHTAQNLLRTKECVLNLPADSNVTAVDKLALTTGANPVPAYKAARGYRHVQDKFGVAELSALPSKTVDAERIGEFPVHLEAVVEAVHTVGNDDEKMRGHILVFETRIQRVHAEESILMDGQVNRIDPDKWRPLIMSFQRFYGLTRDQAHGSRLSSIPEHVYRSPDVDRARECATR